MKPTYIVSACRTAIGNFGGSLSETSPSEMGRVVFQEAMKRAGLTGGGEHFIDECIVGNVLGAGHGMNMARQISIKSEMPVATPSYTINKVCGSGLKAVCLAASAVGCGDADVVVAGGAESMSQATFVSSSMRWGARMGHAEFKDLMISDGLTDVFNNYHMGITAENLAEKYNISREDQDVFSLESQKKAKLAIDNGYFTEEIASVNLYKRGKQIGSFSVDEYPKKDCTLESLKSLKPAFKKDGTVTAGNASGINDGAAALIVMSEEGLKKCNAKPLFEIVGYASGGVSPEVMGIGPVEAVQKLLKRTGLTLDKFDLIEANEAFAVQAIAVNRLLGLNTEKVNVSGGAIALGHPIGASGARILVTLVHSLRRTEKELGLATLCVGGGQGIAIAIRRC